MKYQSILTSYLIGLPIGLFTVLVFLLMPSMLTGEGLATIAMIGIYGKAILGLTISFLFALGIGGHYITVNIEKRRTLLSTSFRYSLTINAIVWTVFILLTIANNDNQDLWLILTPPIIAFFVCTILSTFTLGLFICDLVRQKTKLCVLIFMLNLQNRCTKSLNPLATKFKKRTLTMKILFFILFPIIVFGQKGAMTYAEANPGGLNVLIDVSSDTAHLKSIIGVLQKNDISKLKTFLGKNDTLERVTQSGKSKKNTDEQVKNILDKVLQRNIEPCKILASDTSYAIFNTP